MNVFAEFGTVNKKPADSEDVQALVKKLQDTISENYYSCDDKMLANLGQMYSADPRFRENIDKAGGEGTAAFVSKAIAEYCK